MAHKATEEAWFYHETLRHLHELDKVWKELRNLGLCSSGLDSPYIITTAELNSHFFNISSDPAALSVSEFLKLLMKTIFLTSHFLKSLLLMLSLR